MNRMRRTVLPILLGASIGWLAFLAACSQGERLAGSSTEAGNAGGKLSLSDGSAAAGISVALVARDFVPDTGGLPPGDKAGAFYRTRTGPDGRYFVEGVKPGRYRVMAVGSGGGTMNDSVIVMPGPDTARYDGTLKPLGSVRGVAKVMGTDAKVNVWVSPVATVKHPPLADSAGGFRLDSLPEGEYELLPQCFSCAQPESPYKVKVRAGMDSLLPDTLKLYPEIMAGLPDSGDYEVRAAWLPMAFEGKWDENAERHLRPLSALWTWNGRAILGRDLPASTGLKGTSVVLDAGLFGAATVGRLRVELAFPDTLVSRSWTLRLDRDRDIHPLQLVEADSAVAIRGPEDRPRWRIRPVRSQPLDRQDVAFWGLEGMVTGPSAVALPEWVSLGFADARDTALLLASGTRRLTFILVPDTLDGGRILRPRRDERFEDFGRIRLFDRARLGFPDALVPTLAPEALILDRTRRAGVLQRYRVLPSQALSEDLGPLHGLGIPASLEAAPLLFHRMGRVGGGYDWRDPVSGAEAALVVFPDGRDFSTERPGASLRVPEAELAILDSLLRGFAGDPPSRPDTAFLPETAALEVLHYSGRGHLRPRNAADTLLRGFRDWRLRNGFEPEGTGFPLETGVWRFEGFAMSPGFVPTGDTLVLRLTKEGDGVEARESLSPGSPGRAGDTLEYAYRLFRDGDTLRAAVGSLSVPSRLFGLIEGTRTVFAVSGLANVNATIENGLPILDAGGRFLSGRIAGTLSGWGRTLRNPGLLLDQRRADNNAQGLGLLYTMDGGLERSWLFGGRSGEVKGWNRL
jgi:hypothetical protein